MILSNKKKNCQTTPLLKSDGLVRNVSFFRINIVDVFDRKCYKYIFCFKYYSLLTIGVWKPRRATDGSDLPSAKQVSEQVHRPSYEEDRDFTVMLAVWGQFMDHDITATALSRGEHVKFTYLPDKTFEILYLSNDLWMKKCFIILKNYEKLCRYRYL